jgi:small subunit ribosomal protein S27Ae
MSRHELYADDGTTDHERCPRCEDAFLAEHGDRHHCGGCGYTEWQ